MTMERFPTPDLMTPEPELVVRILDHLDARVAAGEGTAFFCGAALGRTGTIAGCWLVRHGVAEPANAVDAIHDLRRGCRYPDDLTPQTPAQRDLVEAWSRGR